MLNSAMTTLVVFQQFFQHSEWFIHCRVHDKLESLTVEIHSHQKHSFALTHQNEASYWLLTQSPNAMLQWLINIQYQERGMKSRVILSLNSKFKERITFESHKFQDINRFEQSIYCLKAVDLQISEIRKLTWVCDVTSCHRNVTWYLQWVLRHEN